MKTISIKNFTNAIIITCLIGANIVSLNLGFFKLSPYRIIIIFSLLLVGSSFNGFLRNKKKNYDFNYVFFLLIWIIYSSFSLIWVKDYLGWAKVVSFLIPGFVSTIFIFAYVKTKKDIIRCMKLIIWISVIYSGLAFYEIFTGNYFFLFDDNLEFYKETVLLSSATGIRPPITVFGNPNDYSLFLYFSLVFAFILYKIEETKFLKYLYLIFVLIAFFLIICTQSRSSFIGTIVFFFTYAFVFFLRKSLFYKSFTIISLAIFLLVFVPVVQNVFWIFTDVTSFEFDNNGEGTSDGIRMNLIKNGIIFLFNSGFLGVGLGNIEYYMKFFAIYNTGGIENMHNWWLEILISSGVFIFSMYMYVYFSAIRRNYKKYKKSLSPDERNFYAIFFCFFVGFIVSCIGSSSLITSEWIWPLMAISINASYIEFKLVG